MEIPIPNDVLFTLPKRLVPHSWRKNVDPGPMPVCFRHAVLAAIEGQPVDVTLTLPMTEYDTEDPHPACRVCEPTS